jgi:asparagine synthase (glutamine-hydrolysing)
MCGIAVIVSYHSAIPTRAVEQMTRELLHRGPDAQGVAYFPQCHLGHCRLSIIDLVRGAQPMADPSQRHCIVFNGEIYNYRDLRRELERRGRPFRTMSDTEVLLQACLEYGEDVPRHLKGQFAFALWDTVEKRLFAARDRFGEKPLYWARSEQDHLLLASEIKAIIASGLIRPRIDRTSVDAYLSLLYVPPDRTIYENVHVIRPGHAVTFADGTCHECAYWSPQFSASRVGPEEAVPEAKRLVAQAVERQMVADVPVGAFLSGGLDSSTITALMAMSAPQPVRTFAVGFGDLINELPFARAVAERYGTDHHEIQMNIDVAEMLERMAEVYDEPFADSSNIPTYLLSEFAHRHVKVVLSGDGGDEIFGGYEWYLPLLFREKMPNGLAPAIALGLKALALRLLAKGGFDVTARRDDAVRAARAVWQKTRRPDVWAWHIATVTWAGRRRDRTEWWGGRRPAVEASGTLARYRPADSCRGMDRATDFDVRCYLPGDILAKVDRASMAHGLETRAPFLDPDLTEFVLSLPWSVRFAGGITKPVLRAACGNLWPPEVQGRSKQGFGAPVRDWIARPGVRRQIDRVGAAGHPLEELLPGIRTALQSKNPQTIWTLLCLGLWLERHPECLSIRG